MRKNNFYLKKIKLNIIFIYFLLIFVLFLPNFSLIFSKEVLAQNEYYYTYDVKHLFTHCLIAYPSLAFKNRNPMKNNYLADCITSKEFKAIILSLYKNDYVLVKLSSCYSVDKNGNVIKNKVKVPKGKKPLVFSFDDVNYDSKKVGYGMVDKIILDKNSNIASLTKINNKDDIRYDVEFIPILENFIINHPSFSYNGAKGVINLTGYDGVLGYRTSHTNTKNRNSEIKEAKLVINKLKQLGWEFASHSYGHYHMNRIDINKFKKEIFLWKDEVEPLIGKTDVYVYPYGEWQVFENGEICEKHKVLQNAGFHLFCGVGMKDFYSYLPNKKYKVLFMDRKCIDGNTLTANKKELFEFFTPKLVIDSTRFSN